MSGCESLDRPIGWTLQLNLICLACGAELPAALAETASLRCQDCRDARLPLRPELAWLQRAAYDPLLLVEAA